MHALIERSTPRLPPLRAVEIFVAAGRTLSFTEAARSAHLTPSAVSRRMRDLERALGTSLFRRFNRRLELTEAGTRYLEAAGQAIDLIARASDAVRPRRKRSTLRLSALQSLTTLWLMPRLAALKAARPEIDIEIETSAELVDLAEERFDAAIRFGAGHWPGLATERLFEMRAFPVAAPGLLPAGAAASAALLDRTSLLDIAHVGDLWPQYLAGIGLAGYRPRAVLTFDNVQVMHEAAANGMGLALASDELASKPLAEGRLVRPFREPPVALRQSYYLAYRKERQQEPALRALRQALAGGEGPRARLR